MQMTSLGCLQLKLYRTNAQSLEDSSMEWYLVHCLVSFGVYLSYPANSSYQVSDCFWDVAKTCLLSINMGWTIFKKCIYHVGLSTYPHWSTWVSKWPGAAKTTQAPISDSNCAKVCLVWGAMHGRLFDAFRRRAKLNKKTLKSACCCHLEP